MNTIAAYLRAKGKVVISNAYSGITDVLLTVGRTDHAKFKIPLKICLALILQSLLARMQERQLLHQI